MCGIPEADPRTDPLFQAQILCSLMERRFGLQIAPLDMVKFLIRDWSKISVAAHRIHEDARAWELIQEPPEKKLVRVEYNP